MVWCPGFSVCNCHFIFVFSLLTSCEHLHTTGHSKECPSRSDSSGWYSRIWVYVPGTWLSQILVFRVPVNPSCRFQINLVQFPLKTQSQPFTASKSISNKLSGNVFSFLRWRKGPWGLVSQAVVKTTVTTWSKMPYFLCISSRFSW